MLDLIDTLIKGAPYFDRLGVGYLIQVPAGLVLAGIAIFVKDRRYHLGLITVHLCYQFWWITILFDTPIVAATVG